MSKNAGSQVTIETNGIGCKSVKLSITTVIYEQSCYFCFVFFFQKWKERYFVLHKPSGSLPDQYELSYFNSVSCNKKKGSIDLDQCEQIIESLDSDQYPHLLAVKTVCKGKVKDLNRIFNYIINKASQSEQTRP